MRWKYLGAAALAVACGNGTGGGGPSTPVGPAPVPPTPEPAPAGPLALAPGEVAEVSVEAGRAAVRLATPSGAERFVAIVASTNLADGTASFPYTVSTEVAEPTPTRLASGCALSSDRWSGAAVPQEAEPTGTAPTVGTTRTLKVAVGSQSQTITARVAAVGTRAVVWVDETPAHPATLAQSFIDEFLADFDQRILPRERTIFGGESDLDHDGHIGLVFSPLTKDVAVAFFTGCDLKQTAGCPAGNDGEMLYLTPPADIAPPYNTPAAIKEILAHELGHLLHYNQKVLKNGLQDWPDASYLMEGFGALAQDASGLQAGNLYVTQAGLDKIGDFSSADVFGDRGSYDPDRDGALRGGSYLLVRWLYDRAGGDMPGADGMIEGRGGPALLRTLFSGPKSVAATLPDLGAALPDVIADFYTALAMSNEDEKGNAAPANKCFAYLPTVTDPVTGKQRGADMFASFHGQAMTGPATQAAATADGKVRSGGVEYLTLAAAEGQAELDLTVTVGDKAAARVRVGRLK